MIYNYEASDKDGAIVRGEFEAAQKQAVVEYLMKKNLIPVSIEQRGTIAGGGKLSLVIFQRVTPIDRIIFVRNLAASIKAGVSIIEALDILIVDASKNIMKEILTRAKLNLQNGQPLSATFAAQKRIFPPIFVGMLKAGEASGELDSTLNELSRYLTKEYNLRKKVKSALAYPVILLVASTGVVTLLLLFVLPRLAKTFNQSGASLPLLTRILVKISEIITASFILDFIAIGGLVAFFTYFRRTSFGRRLFLKIFFRIPITRELIRKVALVRFTRTLGSLISGGTSIIEALGLAADSVGNEIYRKAILKSIEQVKNGIPFSKALASRSDLFPHFLTSLVVVGERTGSMENILKTFADFYDAEVNHTLKTLTTFLEPVLLLVMGGIIGTIALSILLPIYQLVSRFR